MMLGYQASDSENAYDFRLGFFFNPTDRPTQYQETHSTVNEKKGGWPYSITVLSLVLLEFPLMKRKVKEKWMALNCCWVSTDHQTKQK